MLNLYRSTRRTIAVLVLAMMASGCGNQAQEHSPEVGSPDMGLTADGSPAAEHLSVNDGQRGDRTAPTAKCPVGANFYDSLRKVQFAAKVNGKGPYAVFYDTGAPTSYLSSKITGKGEGESFDVQSIDLGNGQVLGPITVRSTKQLYDGMDGLIGNDVMMNKVVTIDYGRKRFWVDDSLQEASLAACTHVDANPVTVPFVHDNGFVYVDGNVDGVSGPLLVDTGASLGVIHQFAVEQSSIDHAAVDGLKLDALIGIYWSSYIMFNKISVGQLTVERLITRTIPDGSLPGPTGLIGTLPYGFMQHFMVTVDFNNQVLRLSAVKGHELVDNFPVPGFGLSLSINDSGPVSISRMVPQSPADKAGLKKGDEVISINGKDPSTVAPADRIDLVLGMKPGTEATFITERNGTQTTTKLIAAKDLFAGVP